MRRTPPPTGQILPGNVSPVDGVQRFYRDFFPQLTPYLNIRHANDHIKLDRILATVINTKFNPHVSNIVVYLSAHAAFSVLDTIDAIAGCNDCYATNTAAQADLSRIRHERNTPVHERDTAINERDTLHADSITQSKTIATITADINGLPHERNTIITELNLTIVYCKQHVIEHHRLPLTAIASEPSIAVSLSSVTKHALSVANMLSPGIIFLAILSTHATLNRIPLLNMSP
ncbi:hypothetical protein SARC_00044 [Sphaeroforma arctica JP610]|uniref:Uncharacterized protein n=1 Tax=Sphaeroforma arctica JP610 TaxID=667725 RepID=A0A0L0GG35_9EUKA|nr:hypothetical protein SARC_00044 [Sphaeroforma arctica JP610]KNC87786.1 hypothetical protein SARC_00044 [Sphaeroforma arctica JP610]|eukprot:XP_014161688.1 hypothetical protein SARC_00044 [Sphaeroforma arctica JP610]